MISTNTLMCAGESHTGRVRTNNEDRLHFDPERGVFVVVDGVGGQAAGEVAADTAVRVLRTRLERADKPVRERLMEAVTLANNEIFRLSETREEWAGMACVLTAAVVEGRLATVAHVGDTRLYKMRAGRIEKVTRDHSPVGQLEDAGELSEVEAMAHPRRNEVLRDVGSAEHTPEDEGFIDTYEVPFEPDAALLLCSDGLSDLVTSEQMLRAVTQHAGNRSRTVRQLIELANEAGGKDNVSVLFVEGEQFASATRRRVLGLADESSAPESSAPPDEARAARLSPSASSAPDPLERTMREAPARAPQSTAPRAQGALGGRWAFLLYGLLLGLVLPLALLLAWYLWRRAGDDTGAAKEGGQQQQQQTPQQPAGARARAHFVADSSELAAAIERAQAGETVVAAPGRYAGPVRLKSGVALVSLVPRGAVVVPGEDARFAVSADHVEGARLSGFLVDGEGRTEVGVSLRDSTVGVEDLEVTGTTAAGVQMVGGESRLRANYIHDNAAVGVSVLDAARPDIRHNTFARNGEAGQLDIYLDERAAANVVENYFDDRRNNVGPARRGSTENVMRQNSFPPER